MESKTNSDSEEPEMSQLQVWQSTAPQIWACERAERNQGQNKGSEERDGAVVEENQWRVGQVSWWETAVSLRRWNTAHITLRRKTRCCLSPGHVRFTWRVFFHMLLNAFDSFLFCTCYLFVFSTLGCLSLMTNWRLVLSLIFRFCWAAPQIFYNCNFCPWCQIPEGRSGSRAHW